MSEAGSNAEDPEIDRINLRISRPFLDVVDEARRERGFTSRSEFIRYALRDAVNHPEGAGPLAGPRHQRGAVRRGAGISSEAVKAKHGLDGE